MKQCGQGWSNANKIIKKGTKAGGNLKRSIGRQRRFTPSTQQSRGRTPHWSESIQMMNQRGDQLGMGLDALAGGAWTGSSISRQLAKAHTNADAIRRERSRKVSAEKTFKKFGEKNRTAERLAWLGDTKALKIGGPVTAIGFAGIDAAENYAEGDSIPKSVTKAGVEAGAGAGGAWGGAAGGAALGTMIFPGPGTVIGGVIGGVGGGFLGGLAGERVLSSW